MNAPHLTRRDFTAGLGGIVLAFSLTPRALTQQAPRLPGSLQTDRLLSAWIAIHADGTATVFTGKVELNQSAMPASWRNACSRSMAVPEATAAGATVAAPAPAAG